MADYPGIVPSFVDLADDVDFVEAEDQNLPNDEITALATALGNIGSGLTQASSIDFLEFFRKARQSFRLSWVDADTVQVSAGEIVCTNSAASQRVARKNTSTANVTFSDLDTGARATSTTYYVWAVADAVANTVTFKLSLSSSAPTGVTRYGIIGKISTDATGSGEIIESSVVSYVGEQVVNTINVVDGDVATGTIVIPDDDTIPQNTEGDQYMSLVKLPLDTNNSLRVDVVASFAFSTDGTKTVALFKDSVANALASMRTYESSTNISHNVMLTYHMTAGTTDAITFKVRIGGDRAGTLTFNGVSAAGKCGGTLASSITITEYRKVYI